VDALVKAAVPGAKISINAEKPRKGCFEIRVDGAVVLSLTDMPRPFTKLKALDMDAVRCAITLTPATVLLPWRLAGRFSRPQTPPADRLRRLSAGSGPGRLSLGHGGCRRSTPHYPK